jgi:hypothetical protein
MSQQSRPPETLAIVNAYAIHTASSEELWSWACDALELGCDSANLRILAGLVPPHDSDEVRKYFALALRDLGIAVAASHDAALRDRLWLVAKDLLRGTLPIEPTLTRLHVEVIAPLNHASDVLAWCLLSEGLEPGTYAQLSTDELHARVLEEARKFTSSYVPSFSASG